MKLRPPAIPLITSDPYFSVWSQSDKLYESDTVHWTSSPETLKGYVYIDGEKFRFMGSGNDAVINQTFSDMKALSSRYTFSDNRIKLDIWFYSSLFTDDLYRLSRPVSFMRIIYSSVDGEKHQVKIKISASEEFCLDKRGQKKVSFSEIEISDAKCGRIGADEQNILSRSGDDLRIDWGYFYLTSPEEGKVYAENNDNMLFIVSEFSLNENNAETVLFAYDDIKSIDYFGYKAEAFWRKTDKDIKEAIDKAYFEDNDIFIKCIKFSSELHAEAEEAGGEEYAELLELAYRQVIAAHKLISDEKGEAVYISKECFSNGCAATVDVTYPSSPFFILYNTELLKGMLRPVLRYAESSDWKFDFAPHDVGTYPLVLGQQYGRNEPEEKYLSFQMPVEECGNILIMMTSICLADRNTEFFDKYEALMKKWLVYLEKYGMDPENQLCTDDFAGHLAHNCNLSLKAIMGIAGYSLILGMKNDDESSVYFEAAKKMADNWIKTAANKDGSFRLAFDRADTFSMKYNMIWDKLWGTGLFPPCVYYSEFSSNKKHINPYGMPLDCRKSYTKSDWLVWTASLSPTKEEFISFIRPMWRCFNVTPSRVPMTDWYDTDTSLMVGFRHRSVQGGLYIKLLENKLYRGI